jgi:hypothetical protein
MNLPKMTQISSRAGHEVGCSAEGLGKFPREKERMKSAKSRRGGRGGRGGEVLGMWYGS